MAVFWLVALLMFSCLSNDIKPQHTVLSVTSQGWCARCPSSGGDNWGCAVKDNFYRKVGKVPAGGLEEAHWGLIRSINYSLIHDCLSSDRDVFSIYGIDLHVKPLGKGIFCRRPCPFSALLPSEAHMPSKNRPVQALACSIWGGDCSSGACVWFTWWSYVEGCNV